MKVIKKLDEVPPDNISFKEADNALIRGYHKSKVFWVVPLNSKHPFPVVNGGYIIYRLFFKRDNKDILLNGRFRLIWFITNILD